MTDFTRITVIGSVKKATIVVPSDEPIATLLPEIADVIGEPAAASGLTLVGRLGDEVELALSTADQALVDGSVFRLVAVADAPPPPEVSDVTAAVAETLDSSSGRWNSTHRTTAAALGLGAAAALINTSSLGLGGWFAPTLYVVAILAAVLVGALSSRRIAVLIAALAVGSVPASTLWLAETLGNVMTPSTAVIVQLGLLLVWLALAPIGGRRSLLGAGVGALLSVLFIALHFFGATDVEAAAILAIAVIAGLGLVPALAINASGLATLDDKVIAGVPAERFTVRARVVEAYKFFGWAVFALAASGTVAVAVLLAAGTVWSVILAAAVVAVMVLRTRVMPLAVQAWALWVAAGLGVVLAWAPGIAIPAASAGQPWVTALALAVIMAVIVLAATLSPRPHTRIRLRRCGDLMEGLAVLVLVPAVLGIFGVYEIALGMFS